MTRPAVTLKLATSLDGRIATKTGESRWITGPDARAEAHRLRAAHDAILVGVGTALADDPELTVRLEGLAAQPLRVVLDSRARLASESRLATTPEKGPVLVIVGPGADAAALREAGVAVAPVPLADGRVDLAAALAVLAARGVTRLFVEGGGEVAASFVAADLVDRIEWFRAPILLGAEGRPALGPLPIDRLSQALPLRRLDVRPLGPDLWERYERAR